MAKKKKAVKKKASKVKVMEAEIVESGEFIPDAQPLALVAAGDESFDMPSDEVRQNILKLRDSLQDDYVELCRLLYHANKKMMYKSWGYGTFDEYVSREMEFERSKARYLVQIWECLYARQANKEVFNKVMSLGWTKASKLVNVVTDENVDEWVEKGRHKSVENLADDVKRYKDEKISSDPKKALEKAGEVEGTPLELATKATTLQQSHDDYLAMCQAVEMVQAMHPEASISQAVSLMARDFVASNPISDEKIDPRVEVVKLIQRYEEMSGYQIVVIDPANKEVVYGYDNLVALKSDDSESTDELPDVGEDTFDDEDMIPEEDAFA